MSSISLDASGENYIITIDKKAIDKDLLMQYLDNLSLEMLTKKISTDQPIDDTEINKVWWKEKNDVDE